MTFLLWDASALLKRYHREVGTESTMQLFSIVPSSLMATTIMGYAETVAILVRRRNNNEISAADYRDALSSIEREVLLDKDHRVLDTTFNDVLGGIDLVKRHNLNSSDAAILMTFLRFAASQEETCILIAADRRLLRAARAEGLTVLNPEAVAAEDIPALVPPSSE